MIPDGNYDLDNSRVQVHIKVFFDLFVSYHYSIIVSTGKIEYSVHSTIGLTAGLKSAEILL